MTFPPCRPRRMLAALLLAAAIPVLAPAQDATVARTDVKPTRTVGADFSYVSFDDATQPWRLSSVSLSRRTAAGSLIARLNYANRFATDGLQVEADAYPRLSDRVYLYLNAGYSSATVFPEWRFGGEAFTSLPAAWEASLGFRQLRFSGYPVTLFTGAVGKYIGNYWFSLRPYVRSKEGALTASAGLTARRYFEDGDHWVGAAWSYGRAPTDRVSPDAVASTRVQSMSINGSSGLTPRLMATWTLGRDVERLSALGPTRRSVTLTAGFKLSY